MIVRCTHQFVPVADVTPLFFAPLNRYGNAPQSKSCIETQHRVAARKTLGTLPISTLTHTELLTSISISTFANNLGLTEFFFMSVPEAGSEADRKYQKTSGNTTRPPYSPKVRLQALDFSTHSSVRRAIDVFWNGYPGPY